MTEDEIKNMPAGRELDALIAKRLDLYAFPPHIGDRVIEVGEHKDRLLYIRPFSMDIAAAIDALNTVYQYKIHKRSEGIYEVSVQWEKDSEVFDGIADTLSLAVCRALLARESK